MKDYLLFLKAIKFYLNVDEYIRTKKLINLDLRINDFYNNVVSILGNVVNPPKKFKLDDDIVIKLTVSSIELAELIDEPDNELQEYCNVLKDYLSSRE